MSKLHKVIILLITYFTLLTAGFQDVNIANKTYHGWHRYKYFENNQYNKEIERIYIMSEQHPRAYLMCPKGIILFFRIKLPLTV